MGDDSDALEPLPALKLYNSSPPYTPLQGEGALGNQYHGQMHYQGSDRVTLVETLPSRLVSLGYDVGPTGVDGKFGDKTEKAVRTVQEENKEWAGSPLQGDG
jgi:peptidoglycan hydrolase-like protein with peptidoglycan-binding domain